MDRDDASSDSHYLISWSFINPTTSLGLVISIGLIIAVASATQDITVDALRIEQIGEHEGKSMQTGQLWRLSDGGLVIN